MFNKQNYFVNLSNNMIILFYVTREQRISMFDMQNYVLKQIYIVLLKNYSNKYFDIVPMQSTTLILQQFVNISFLQHVKHSAKIAVDKYFFVVVFRHFLLQLAQLGLDTILF